ncbi:MAG: hypothetical protein HY554_04360, partial [Elusimicrobia bacterium]|nr:hypothetical protein [Elusimicrobiota bacterium]
MKSAARSGPYFVGADLGASWLRVAVVDARGAPIRRARLAAVPPREAAAALARQLAAWGLRPAALVLGSTRLGRASDRARVRRALLAVAPRARVLADLELAWAAALGGAPGVLLLSGTGSVAYGRDACGHAARVGGLGPLLGDEGSAFWLGRQWLRRTTGGEDFEPVRSLV